MLDSHVIFTLNTHLRGIGSALLTGRLVFILEIDEVSNRRKIRMSNIREEQVSITLVPLILKGLKHLEMETVDARNGRIYDGPEMRKAQ